MKKLIATIAFMMALTSAAHAETIKVSVNGLVCSFCATGVEKTFKSEPAVQGVNVDLDTKLVTIKLKDGQTMNDATVTKLITDAGYNITNIARENP